jgi:hypothetical protein
MFFSIIKIFYVVNINNIIFLFFGFQTICFILIVVGMMVFTHNNSLNV